MIYSITDIERALQLPDFDGLAAQGKMIPVPRLAQRPLERSGQARVGAVLLVLYLKNERLHLVLTRRLDSLRSHAGQISLPGGRRDGTETLPEAALRETQEEIGLDPARLRLLGELSPLYIPPSDFEVHPFVAWHEGRPIFRISPLEVEEVIEVPLTYLADRANQVAEAWEIRGQTVQVPYFYVAGHKVWGATAMILSEFLARLERVKG